MKKKVNRLPLLVIDNYDNETKHEHSFNKN